MTTRPWLLYGAYGYTGELIARRAVAEGERPILVEPGALTPAMALGTGFVTTLDGVQVTSPEFGG